MAGVLRRAEGRCGRCAQERQGASWAKPSGRYRPMANWCRRSTATGASFEKHLEKKVKDKAVTNGIVLSDADVHQLTRDLARAIMMIRAYRMRGHLHANSTRSASPSRPRTTTNCRRRITASRSRLRPADLPRQCARARIRHHPADAGDPDGTYCSTLGVEFMHISIPRRRPASRRASKAPTRRSPSPRGARRRSSKADRGRGLRAIHRRQVQGHQALRPRRRRVAIPALEQIIKRGG